jgi:hypothetical protein
MLCSCRQLRGPVIRIGEMNVSGGANDGGGYGICPAHRNTSIPDGTNRCNVHIIPRYARAGCGGDVFFQNIGVSGYETGIHIVNSAWVRFRNVGAKAAVYTGGPHNAAMVVENSFWQWFEEGSAFAFRCDGQSDCRGRASVLLRGNNDTEAFVRTVYGACVFVDIAPTLHSSALNCNCILCI